MENQNKEEEELRLSISKRLKVLRKERALSQEDVYNDTGIHISRIETGKINITVITLGKLCKYFKIHLSDFFTDI